MLRARAPTRCFFDWAEVVHRAHVGPDLRIRLSQAAANLFSLIASCMLHGLDPESYLPHIFRFMPYWPRDRYLELGPKYWSATRARLVEAELALPLGHLTVPPAPAPQQQASAS